MADITGQNPATGSTPAITGPSFEGNTADDRQALLDAHKRNIELGFLAAGLTTMAAGGRGGRRGETSVLGALGEGGLAGLRTYESGEQNARQDIARRQQAQSLQNYRQQEIGIRQGATDATNRRTDLMAGSDQEKVRHDKALEQSTQQAKDIQQQNADTNHYRATLEAQRNGTYAASTSSNIAKNTAEISPVGTDVVGRFRGTNVEKLVPLLDPAVVAAMPKKDADAYAREVTTAYSRLAKDPSLKIDFRPMGDGKVHKFVTDPKTGKTTDTTVGPAVIKTGKTTGLIDPTTGKMRTDAPAPVDGTAPPSESPVPSAATATTNATPKEAPPAGPPKQGKRLGVVDGTKFGNGVYKEPGTGKRVIIKDGVIYEAN